MTMERKRITIGRDTGNDIHIDEQWDLVSNRHGEIICNEGKLTFIDHSSNGTVINGQKIQNTSVGIYPGDSIRLANVFALEWDVIERFFPRQQRPTVTRNVRAESQDAGRRTLQMQAANTSKGRETEQFSNGIHGDESLTRPNHRQNDNMFGQANEYSQSEIDKEIEKWNWGAFFCSWLWGTFNGIYWPLACILISVVPYLGQVCSLCLCVYLGLNGSKMAWRKGKYENFDRFKKAQRLWAIFGIVWFALTIIGNIYLLDYTLTLL